MSNRPLRLSAATCAAALLTAALTQGCAHGSDALPDARTGTQTQASLALSTPVQTPRPTPAQENPADGDALPQPRRSADGAAFVNDFAGVIDGRTEALLEAKVKRLKARARIELAVVTLETTGGRDIFDYSLALARAWGVGPPAGEEGGGLLLLLSVKDRRWHIQVSRSLESDLPGDVTGEIGRAMTPALRAGRYGEAVTKCVDGLIKRLSERRGFRMKDDELILQGFPEGTSEETRKPKGTRPRKP